ncbi:DUF1659 domain-containing protein [Clostridium sp. ZS2]|uniref:DUF1659 domain-containing protein n=1 Tax=Clostridium sp. ZS2 TaxID=2949988 RepID=UPI002079BDD0|nr:DUF1659 domain-containing protein [Clostridium sp. ZS2]
MAVTKILENSSFSIEVRRGTNDSGEPTYYKKSFSNLKTNVDPRNVLGVANAISDVLAAETKNCYLNQTSTLVQE